MNRWIVEQSHMTDVPVSIVARDFAELKAVVNNIKAAKLHRPIGDLVFRHERHRSGDVVYVHFFGYDGKKRRFMRLRRHTHATS